MDGQRDVERGDEYKPLDTEDCSAEEESLLPGVAKEEARITPDSCFTRATKSRYGVLQLCAAFTGGVAACLLAQVTFTSCFLPKSGMHQDESALMFAPTHVGSTERHDFPPAAPTNAFPSLFPSNVGYAGPTPTGGEAGLVATAPALPMHTGAPALVVPAAKNSAKGTGKGGFDMLKYWGNLSPWYSNERGTFGVDSGPEAPAGCAVTGLHFLHRHGARYPTSWGEQYVNFYCPTIDVLSSVLWRTCELLRPLA